jgi:hypothetical protein
MAIKSYDQFVNENLVGQYSFYGQGSLFPIVSKLASEGKNPSQIYLFLTSLGIDEERKQKVMSQVFLKESLNFDELNSINEGLFEDDDEIDDLVNASPEDLAKGVKPEKAKTDQDVKTALDKLKGKEEEDIEDKDTSKSEEEDKSTKIAALQAALQDADKLEKIKKILTDTEESDED